MRRHLATGVVVAGLLLAFASLYSIRAEWPTTDPERDFTMSVWTELDPHAASETVSIATQVCSRRWWWRVPSNGPGSWQVVDEEGRTVTDTSHRIHQMNYVPTPWAPRQCRTFWDEWDQRFWNQEERRSFTEPVRGDRVPGGEYRVRASWTAISARDDPPLPRHPTVESQPFTIEP